MSILINVALIAIIIALFNLIIFVHELGHFLAARWRGLQVDRFQIWFGKPLWKKTYNGVQYGIGWLPFGGFVALPQMAPMESIEGDNRGEDGKPLPKVKPLDKIIVALAGPIFSMLLALAAAIVITYVGKPRDFVDTTEIGYVAKGSPAQKAGLQVGDEILKINGEEVDGFLGSLDSVQERIMLSKGNKIEFVVNRPGQSDPLTLTSTFDIEPTRWWQRSGLRKVGIWVPNKAVIHAIQEDSPAERAGLEPGDVITKVNGEDLANYSQFMAVTSESPNIPVEIEVVRDGANVPLTIVPLIPTNHTDKENMDAKIGAMFGDSGEVDVKLVKPSPLTQVGDSVRMMWVTITSVIAKDSSIGAEHLAGPVGIGSVMFDLLLSENGWRRLITFLVLFNVNLAILNMLPLPVLDGGHVVLSLGEMVAGRPVKAKILEVVQTGFAMVLLCFFLYITSKDIGDKIRPKSPSAWVFPTEAA